MTTKSVRSFFLAVLFVLALPCSAQAAKGSGYDPLANPSTALERAFVDAKAKNKKVLVIAGGDWCRWCLILNSFLDQSPEVKAELDASFVTVKVYIGADNANAQFFSTLPRAKGYPHFWVLSKDGRTIHSVSTGRLENGRDSYDKSAFLRFIRDVGKD
jgi:thioredoxin-related protein